MPWFKVWLRRHVGWDALAAQESVLDDCPGDRWMQQRLVKARPEIVPSREWHRVRGQNFQRHAFTSCGIPKHVDFGCCKFLLHGGPVHDDCCLCCQRYIRLKWLQGIYIYIHTHTVYTWYDFLAKHRLTCLRPWSCCRGGFNLDKSGFTLSCTGKRQSVFQFEWSLGVSIYVSLYVCIFSGVVGVAAIHFKEIRGNRQSCTPRLIRLKRWMRCRHVGRLDGGSQRDGHKSSSCRVLMWIPVVLISFQCVAQCRSNAFPFSCDAQSEHCWSHSTTAANSGARLVLARQCSNCIKIASCICRRTPVDNLDILMQFCFFVTSCHTFGICWRQLTSFDSESKDFYTAFATSSIDAKTNCNGKCSIRLFRRIW